LIHLTTCFSIGFIVYWFSEENIISSFKSGWKILFVLGLFHAGLWFVQARAYTLIDVAYVQAIKRSSILIVIIIGKLYFKESKIPQRILAASIMTLGVILVIFGL